MSTTIKMRKAEQEERIDWKAGLYQVVIDDVNDHVVEEDSKYNKAGDELFTFVFRIIKDGEYKNRLVWKDWVKPFISAPRKGKDGSNLYKIVKAVFPDLSDLELFQKEDANELIGKQLILSIKPQEDPKYCRITDYIPAEKELPVPEDTRKKSKDEVNVEDLPF